MNTYTLKELEQSLQAVPKTLPSTTQIRIDVRSGDVFVGSPHPGRRRLILMIDLYSGLCLAVHPDPSAPDWRAE